MQMVAEACGVCNVNACRSLQDQSPGRFGSRTGMDMASNVWVLGGARICALSGSARAEKKKKRILLTKRSEDEERKKHQEKKAEWWGRCRGRYTVARKKKC